MTMHRGSQDVSDFDFRLQHPFSCVVSGPSNSGKSYFVKLLLEKGLNIISKKIENIVWLYDCWQTLYDDLLQLYDIKFIQGIPQSLNDDDLLPVTTANLLVVDDLMDQASANVELQRVFTQYCHHRNLSSMFIVTNLFAQGKSSRTISLNANYMILFKNPRDVHQVSMLGRQMHPGNTKYFMECYHDAVDRPFGYLMIDYKAKTPEQYRLRTGLLSDRQVVYIPKKRRA